MMRRSEFLRLSTTGVLACALWPNRAWGSLDFSFQGTPSGIRPYLHAPRPNSMRISWWTNSDDESFIDYGLAADQLNATISGNRKIMGPGYHYHSGQLTGLQPATFYHYRVRTERATSEVFRFRTPKPVGTATGKFRVLILGDNQILTSERRYERYVERAKKKVEDLYGTPIEEAIDLIIMPGDQVDVGTLNHYRNLHFAYNGWVSPYVPIMTTIGNHETYQDPGLANYRALFTYDDLNCMGVSSPNPEIYYAYQLANIAFVHTSSEHTGSTQLGWVQDLVNAANNDESVDWMVSLCHRPYNAEQYIGDISGWLRNTAMPVLAQTPKHVLNIGAHHHIYARGQTRDWPIYHLINGGTSWDQYWGQSNEANYDDVQKTFAHWTWQLAEFDLEGRVMDVRCFAEANVRFPESQRWTTRSYNSKLIDRFHRKLALGPPNQPTLESSKSGTITLPVELVSSAFFTTTGEALNSTQFQLATDETFTNVRVDRLRDVEDIYGDTGAPDYHPIDVNEGVDILRYEIPADGVPNGVYFLRMRHRDTNAQWSAWSPVLSIEVTGSNASTDPQLMIAKPVYAPGEGIGVNFMGGAGKPTDWIGIYRSGQQPGEINSTQWFYLNGTTSAGAPPPSGLLNFTRPLPEGRWFAGFFTDNGYQEIAPRAEFYVGTKVLLSTEKEAFEEGEVVKISFAQARGASTDWVGIYRRGREPNDGLGSDAWSYLDGSKNATAGGIDEGTLNFPDLPKGFYFADYFLDGGYFGIGERILFSVGEEIGEVSMSKEVFKLGEEIPVDFQNGPGTPKDWMGLFKRGDDPGVDALTAYLYVNGDTNGMVTFSLPDLPPGDYFVALFIDDSYTAVSNRLAFKIAGNEDLCFEEFGMQDGEFEIGWMSRAGNDYEVYRSTDLEDWTLLESLRGSGQFMRRSYPSHGQLPRAYYRVVLSQS